MWTALTGTRKQSIAASPVRSPRPVRGSGRSDCRSSGCTAYAARHPAARGRRAGEGPLGAPRARERHDHAHRLPARAPEHGPRGRGAVRGPCWRAAPGAEYHAGMSGPSGSRQTSTRAPDVQEHRGETVSEGATFRLTRRPIGSPAKGAAPCSTTPRRSMKRSVAELPRRPHVGSGSLGPWRGPVSETSSLT
jgi:hypothetical protein